MAKTLVKLEEQKVTDEVFIGLVEMLSISFEFFEHRNILYASILRQILRICGLVMSCFWQISNIDAYICSSIADDQKGTIAENISKLQYFASDLHEIECTANLFERNIREMKRTVKRERREKPKAYRDICEVKHFTTNHPLANVRSRNTTRS